MDINKFDLIYITEKNYFDYCAVPGFYGENFMHFYVSIADFLLFLHRLIYYVHVVLKEGKKIFVMPRLNALPRHSGKG